MNVADNVLDAVSILIDDKVSNLQFNKTIRAKISEIIDSSIGKYKVQYQNSYFTAYASDSNTNYAKGSDVYVEILSNDFEKNALILGTVRRLGSNYITIIEELDKFYNIGSELPFDTSISFCSYAGAQTQTITGWDSLAVSEYAAAADVMKLGMKIQNKLGTAQRTGGGNYGINVIVEYYDEAYANPKSYPAIERLYTFDINDMTGQPYKYIIPSEQYALFEIDAKNFKEIKSIIAFCKDFPLNIENKPDDIWFSDINIQFMKALTEEQLQATFLAIDTPYGNYFTQNGKNEKVLKADLRIKGKKVNYDSQQIDFYWFKRNLEIDSNDSRFSVYGGNGWELLNTTSLNTYEYTLSKNLCSIEKTDFKCVAVYTDSGQSVSISAYITIKNISASTLLNIESSMGQVFSFNLGKTRLTLLGYNKTSNTRYCWTESINGGAETYYNNQKFITNNFIDVNIATPAANSLTYECSVYEGTILIGSAKIVLINNKESLGYTLVLKDAQQIFKYDTYGTSPASQAMAAADRMSIPVLSFDIYDKQGQLIDIADSDKNKYMSIKWLWPAPVGKEKETMLTTTTSLTTITVRDIANNRTIQKKASIDKPIFTYGIRDIYNAELANTDVSRNNIILEVDYQGEHLVASTNFTFTKEGELGTNGTKYVARIIPKAPYKEIFIMGANLYGIQQSGNTFNFTNLGTSRSISTIFEAQLWNGRNNVISNASVKWSIASSTMRTGKQRLTINQNNAIIVQNGSYTFSNVLQATITLNNIKYYATYPIIYTTGLNNNKMLYIADGYREVMYENDGTRGKFNGLPFMPKWFSNAGLEDTTTININAWSSSWGTSAVQVANSFNQFTIEPPSFYNAEQTGYYISLKIGNITTYVPIELYLNRYGMSAMNDWDGNSIQVNNNGGYILSPQVGAGRKENDNSFTGITIGEVFQNVNNKEIGMFGYYKGARSLFLDAETGDAEFGIVGKGQIKIHASDGEGTIDSGDYNTTNKTGLKIKFTSTGSGAEKGPYIKYGSGNFSVDSNGNITAKGDGNIAGWKIDNNNIYSNNKLIYLNSSTPKIYGQTNASQQHSSLTSSYNGFYLASDGLSIGSRFKVTSDGVVRVGKGAYNNSSKHWIISDDGTNTYLRYGTRGSNESVNIQTNEITLGSQFYINDTGVARIGYGAVNNTNKHWTITGNSSRSYVTYGNTNAVPTISGASTNLNGSTGTVYLGTDGIRLGTKFGVDSNGNVKMDNLYACSSGNIGGFTITSTQLKASNNKLILNSEGSILGPSDVSQTDYNKFTPNKRMWEISPGGVAYFTDVKIKNKTANGNILSWEDSGGNNIFKLTDSGSFIGGWSISGNELSSTKNGITVGINSNNVGTGNSVISVGEALKIYGNGSLDSTGAANFSGGGSIGGASFAPTWTGGAVNFPSGVMQFGGATVTLNTHSFVSSLYPQIGIDTEKVEIEYTPEGTISGTFSGSAKGYVSLGLNGQDSQGGSISGSASGNIDIGCSGDIAATFTGTKATLQTAGQFMTKLTKIEIHYTTHVLDALSTGLNPGVDHTASNGGGGDT